MIILWQVNHLLSDNNGIGCRSWYHLGDDHSSRRYWRRWFIHKSNWKNGCETCVHRWYITRSNSVSFKMKRKKSLIYNDSLENVVNNNNNKKPPEAMLPWNVWTCSIFPFAETTEWSLHQVSSDNMILFHGFLVFNAWMVI